MTKAPIVLIFALAMAIARIAGAAEQPTVQAGSELDFRPYAFTDARGQPTGLGPDLLRAVAREMGISLQISPAPWDNAWEDLVAGKVQVLPIVARTAGREPLVDFGVAHTETFDAFFVAEGQPSIKNIAAATGKRIVVLRSDAAHHQLVERQFPGIVIPVDSIAEGLRLVAAGKYDALLCSKIIGVLERQQAGIDGIADGPIIPDYKRTFSFAVNKGNTELLGKLDQGLRIVKTSGEYDRIYNKWLDGEKPAISSWEQIFWNIAGMLGVVALLIVTGVVTRQALRVDRLQPRELSSTSPRIVALIWRYGLAILVVALGEVIHLGLTSLAGSELPPYISFYPAIIIAALLGGIGPGLLATALSAAVCAIWLLPPIGELAINSRGDQIAMVMFIGVSAFMTTVAELSRRNRAKAAAFEREEAIRASEERYRQVVEHAMDGIFLADSAGRYLDVNTAGAAMLGYTRDEVCRLSIQDLLAPEEQTRIREQTAKLAAGTPECNEWRLRRKDGATFIGEVVGRRLPDGRLLGIVRDVSERKAMQDALAEAKDSADRANRAKSAFLANMSHEMRTPLNAIVGLSHLLRRDLENHPAISRIHQLITASDHLMGLISDVLEFSRIEAGQLVLDINDFRLGDVIARVMEVLAWPARSKLLELKSEASSELLQSTFRGDALRLAQVLINLGGNAIKFTDYGHVLLRIEVINETSGTTSLRFTVSDTGIGISTEDQQRLFLPFSQIISERTRDKGGSGLGLVISQQIVTAMGGRIDVTSLPGTGSSFGFEIALPPAGGKLVAICSDKHRDFTGRRVLIAEDDLLSQEIFFEMLENLGCEVEVASDGAEALQSAKSGDYDLILLDMRMPRMDGLEAARSIRGLPRHRHTPIVALSANAFGEDRARCLEAGMDGHIAKPVTPERLAAALSQWIPEIAVPSSGSSFENALSNALRTLPQLEITSRRWQQPEEVAAYLGLLNRLVAQGQEQMAALQANLAAGELAMATDLAHQLKGIAGLLGATTIAECAKATESALRLAEPLPVVIEKAGACSAALTELATALVAISAAEQSLPDAIHANRP